MFRGTISHLSWASIMSRGSDGFGNHQARVKLLSIRCRLNSWDEIRRREGEDHAACQPLFLWRDHLQCHGCLGHCPQPARLVGSCGQEVEVEPDHHPGDLPHHLQHHLHHRRATFQLCHLAQSILLFQPQLPVQTFCIYFLLEPGAKGRILVKNFLNF